jgi:threonine 3-dehydrogenase
MKILITGGAGALAARLAGPLRQRGDEIHLMDIRTPEIEGNFLKVDLGDKNAVLAAVQETRCDSIFHLGAILSADAEANSDVAWRVNMDGARNILEAARQSDVDRVVFSSTVATYGAGLPDPVPLDSPQWPVGLYGVTKVAAERLGVYYHHKFGVDFRAVRLPAVAGPGGAQGRTSAFASAVFEESYRTGRYEFKLEPTTKGPIIYILDAIAALTMLHDAPNENLSRRVYHVNGIGPSADMLAAAAKARIPEAEITYNPDPLFVSIVGSWPVNLDDSDAARDWGWKIGYDLDGMADAFIEELKGGA